MALHSVPLDDASDAKSALEPRVCLVCGREVGWAMDPDRRDGAGQAVETPPAKATVFTSRGNYGSTVYDPAFSESNEYLHAVVCDDCLLEHKERVLHVRYRERREITEAEPWRGLEAD